jgi:hypothetical protein
MVRIATIVGLGALAASLVLVSQSVAAEPTAQAQSCAARADDQGLQGKDRDAFDKTCAKGSLAPKRPTSPAPTSQAAKTVTAPSGADRTVRSRQCNAEAARRGLKDSAMQAFRKGCLASAAPVKAIETAKTPEAPAKQKPKLDALLDAPAR